MNHTCQAPFARVACRSSRRLASSLKSQSPLQSKLKSRFNFCPSPEMPTPALTRTWSCELRLLKGWLPSCGPKNVLWLPVLSSCLTCQQHFEVRRDSTMRNVKQDTNIAAARRQGCLWGATALAHKAQLDERCLSRYYSSLELDAPLYIKAHYRHVRCQKLSTERIGLLRAVHIDYMALTYQQDTFLSSAGT